MKGVVIIYIRLPKKDKITWKSTVLEGIFETGGYEQMISNVRGFDDSKSHPQLRVFFYYNPGNIAFVVVVDDLQDVVTYVYI